MMAGRVRLGMHGMMIYALGGVAVWSMAWHGVVGTWAPPPPALWPKSLRKMPVAKAASYQHTDALPHVSIQMPCYLPDHDRRPHTKRAG